MKWTQQNFSNAHFRGSEARRGALEKFCSLHFNANQGNQELLKSPRYRKIFSQVPGNRAEVAQNHDARKAVSATLSVLKGNCALFGPRGSKVRIRKVLLCPFHCKARPSGVSLASKGLENIPQVPGNPPEVCQNHDARKAVSATFSVLK